MILGSLIVCLLCFGNVQAREIFSFHDRKAADLDHDLEDVSLGNSALNAYDVEHERNHLSIHVFVNAEARNALSDPTSLWPDDKIPYKISDKYDSKEKETILEAMEEFKNKTCVRFEPRGKEETPFILIEPGSGCSATVGKNDEGKVSLGEGCNDKGIIIHELMHTLGFLHEHSRPDRDDYVEINWENIEEKYKQNFKKNSFGEVDDGNITYDYNSIMHYGAHNFAKNRSIPTIITLKENVTIGQRDGFSENDIAKILERYRCGKAADSADKTTQKTPSKSTKSSTQTNKDPIQTTKNPAQSTKNPVQPTKNKTQPTMNPPLSTKNPDQSTKNLIQSTKNPAQSDKMSTLGADKITAGRNLLPTMQKITETKNKGKGLLNKLATAIAKLLAGNKKTTPSLATLAKLGTKTTLKFLTKAKLAAANPKPTSSPTIIPGKGASAYGSGHYRRYKRQAEAPIFFASETDEDVEAPQIAESLEAESPQVVERLGADDNLMGRRMNSDYDDFRVRLEEWAHQYQNWWNFYHKWIQHLKPTTEPTMNIIVEDVPFLTQEHREIKSSVEEEPVPVIKTESQIAKNGNFEVHSFQGGSHGAPSSTNDPHGEVSVPTTTNIPAKTETSPRNFPTSIATPEGTSSEAKMMEFSTSVISSQTEAIPKTNSEGLISTPAGATLSTVNSDSLDSKLTTSGSTSTEAISPEKHPLESEISIDPGITTTKFLTTSAKSENSNTETISSKSTPVISSEITNSLELTTFQNVISTSIEPDSSKPEVLTTGSTAENVNDAGITPNATTPCSSMSSADSSKRTILEGLTSISSDPISSISEVLTTSNTKENVNSEAISPEVTTLGRSSPTADSSEQTTLESVISISSDPGISTRKIPTTGSIAGTANSEVTAPEATTLGNFSPLADSSELTTLENTASTSSDTGRSSTEIRTPSIASTGTKSNKGSGGTTASERVITNVMSATLTTANLGSPRIESDEVKTTENMISTRSVSVSSISESSERTNTRVDETDSTVTTVSDADIESTTLPFELAVEASEHSIPYHKIFMHRSIEGRTALSNPKRLWPNGVVPYEFSNKYDKMQKGFILEGMEAIMNASCVKFVERKNEVSFIAIEPEDKCQSVIGKQPGATNVTLSEGCYLLGTIVHELLHSLGFVHEQNRPDRDSYVMVVWDNIIEEAKSNFKKYSEDKVTTLDVEYDYESVMHYGAYDFAIDSDKPTLVPLQSGVKLGDKEGLSKKDILKLNKLYGCEMKREAKNEEKGKKEGAEDMTLKAQTVLQNLLKYFEMNFQRLFRSILRVVQKFRPIILNAK